MLMEYVDMTGLSPCPQRPTLTAATRARKQLVKLCTKRFRGNVLRSSRPHHNQRPTPCLRQKRTFYKSSTAHKHAIHRPCRIGA